MLRLTEPHFEDLIQNHMHCLTTQGRSQKTIDWYASNLKRFSRFLKSHNMPKSVKDIGISEVRRFIYYLQTEVVRWEDSPNIRDSGRLSPLSVHGYVRTIKAFWSWLLEEGYIEVNPMARLKLPRVPQKVIATFTPEQIQAMINGLNRKTPTGFRDYTIILLLFDTGIRLSELTNLKIDDIDFGQTCLLVRGKGNKERGVPFGIHVRRALWRYIRDYRPDPISPREDSVFLSETRFPLRPRSVQSMISRICKRSGITGVRCSPHTLRHTFAKLYLMEGGDVFSLQKILGHSSLEMVKAYLNLALSDVSQQHRRFSPIDRLVPLGSKKAYGQQEKGKIYHLSGNGYRVKRPYR